MINIRDLGCGVTAKHRTLTLTRLLQACFRCLTVSIPMFFLLVDKIDHPVRTDTQRKFSFQIAEELFPYWRSLT